ncbi:MAG: AAA family ATPase [Phycisphaerales bacterium]|nr:AAA family ATPase [Phycisphaerales bacterium]
MAAQPQRQSGPPQRSMPKGRAIDPVRVLRRYWKGIPLWGIVGAILGTGAFFLFSRIYPLYTGDIMFEVRPGLGEATEIGTMESTNDKMIERVAATQTFLIKDRAILTEAVSNRNMRETTWIQQFVDPATQVVLVDLAVDELEEALKTPIQRGTNLYGVRWSGHVPSDVPIVLNAVADAYMRRTESLDDESFRSNADLFEEEGRRIKLALRDLNDELQGFIQAKGITTLDDSRFSAAMFELQKLTEQLTVSKSGLTATQQNYLRVAAKLDGTLEPTMEDRLLAERDPIILRQQQSLEALESQLRALRDRLDPLHPQVRDMEISVRATKDQIEEKIDSIIERNLNAQLRELITTRDQLSVSLERTESDIENKDAELRELASNQSVFEHLESSRKQLELQRDENTRLISSLRLMQMRADASRVRQATPALEPRQKSFPRIELMLPAGVFIGVAAYLGIVFLREMTDQKIRSASDVLIIPGAKVAGVLPDIHEDPAGLETPELALVHSSEGVFAESCRQAWTGIARAMQQSAHQTLLMLAAAPEAGTTTIIGNFACAAQTAGSRTVVLDCNFRRPHLAGMFEIDDADNGIADVLADGKTLDEVIHRTDTGVDVISAGTPANRLSQRLGSERMKSIFAQLRDKYDIILIDAPPSIVAGDAVLIANLVDAVSLVVHSDRDDRGLVARVLRELSESRAEMLGVMVNAAVGTVGGYFRKNYLAMVSYAEHEDDEDE